VGPQHLNPHGTTHGSALYSLSGAAIAAALNDELTSGVVWQASIDYVAPSREGDELIAQALLGPIEGKDVKVTVDITRADDGSSVATSVASARIRPRQV
jgi:acyl-CoA thioesterase